MTSPSEPEFELAVLDLIERSPVGAVPHTPTYDDALARLQASHQVYASADHKDGHVTARSLAGLPRFSASNLDDLAAGRIGPEALEANGAVFERYVQSLAPALRPAAAAFRDHVAGKPIHHRPKGGAVAVRDPLATLFLVPGGGPLPGLPGNYLHGLLAEVHDASHPRPWRLTLRDSGDNGAVLDLASRDEALDKLREVLECAPFHLGELEAFGFAAL